MINTGFSVRFSIWLACIFSITSFELCYLIGVEIVVEYRRNVESWLPMLSVNNLKKMNKIEYSFGFHFVGNNEFSDE